MGAGGSVVCTGEASNQHAEALKAALDRFSAECCHHVANTLHHEDGDIKCATVAELKEALTKLSDEDRRRLADFCKMQSVVTDFSTKLALLIEKNSEVCDMKPLTDFFTWPNAPDLEALDLQPVFLVDLRTKALELVQAYRDTFPNTYDDAQRAVDRANSVHKSVVQQHEETVTKTFEQFLNFITERDTDGNGVVSLEEATIITKAVFQVEQVPADHPLLAASVGKPLKTMAGILTSNTMAIKSGRQTIEEAERELAEACQKLKVVLEENSLAHYSDLLAKTKEMKTHFDSLTADQFAQASAEAAASKKTWDRIMAGQGVSEHEFVFEPIIPTAVVTTTTETLVVVDAEGVQGVSVETVMTCVVDAKEEAS